MQRTVKVKLSLSAEEKTRLSSLMSQCADIFNAHIDWAFANKTYNKSKAHQALYASITEKFPEIPTGLIQSVRDTAMEAIKALKFKFQPRKKPTSAIRYDQRTITLRGQNLTFSCIGKRIKTQIKIPSFQQRIADTWKFCGATISVKNKQFYANLIYSTITPDIKQSDKVVGIDRGIHYIAVLSDGTKYSGKQIRKVKRNYLYLRSVLQKKGTPSAKRKLKKVSGREMRFVRDVNHCIAKQIVQSQYDILVLEKLTNIGKKNKGKVLNKRIKGWSFYQLEQFLQYKAEAQGKRIVFVDARYTSQKCFACGNIDKTSRNRSHYKCVVCGYCEHADVNAAKNIRGLCTLSTIERSAEQADVNQPIVRAEKLLTSLGACPRGN
jgi:IS605 OrfB family transposase